MLDSDHFPGYAKFKRASASRLSPRGPEITMKYTENASCRFCRKPLSQLVVDLGMSPLCQTHIKPEQLNSMERFYPLRTLLCHNCFLMQLEDFVSPDEIFSEYAYFSSYSDSWVEHARVYSTVVTDRFQLSSASKVIEIASNDGYLLQHFATAGIPVLGIEPAANVAQAAIDKGIETEIHFLGERSAKEIVRKHGRADLVVGNNVLAHVPDINDFVCGIRTLLKDDGVVTMEFPHVVKLITLNQFDTIYHEHFSYLSWYTVRQIFAAHGMTLFDVDELDTHGGSLRIYARHESDGSKPVSDRARALETAEETWGVNKPETYSIFTERVRKTKRELLSFLIEQKTNGKQVVGYGAPGKGNTLLNYCGIRTDMLDYTVDRNPYKQGTYTPGTHIPILPPDRIRETRPDYILVLPWNLRKEITAQLAYIREWGGQLVFPIPELTVD